MPRVSPPLLLCFCAGGEYPDILGRLAEEGSTELLRPAYTLENDLFRKLDEYLKRNQARR